MNKGPLSLLQTQYFSSLGSSVVLADSYNAWIVYDASSAAKAPSKHNG